MIASLPMYDTPGCRAANDRFWQLIRSEFGRGPAELTRGEDPHAQWSDPRLLFSQTCGLPYRSELHDAVHLIGTPDYGVPGCAAGYYNSCIVVRADDPRTAFDDFMTARLARNDHRSQSGWAAIVQHARNLRGDVADWAIIDTGSHAASVAAVADGMADIAAIDAVTWSLLQQERSPTDALRVLCRTEATPGLPYITSFAENPGALFVAVARAISRLTPPDRARLQIKGLAEIPAEAYLAVPLP